MVTHLAKRAMTTMGQKACYVVDHLVEALGNDPSSSLRRAMILADIDEFPGTTQADIMERLNLDKSTVKREIDWLFDYGCIRMESSESDARTKKIWICGYSKNGLDGALGYFEGQHKFLRAFLDGMSAFLKQEKPTLRDAKIVSTLYARKDDPVTEVKNEDLYDSPASTNHRAFTKLREDGVITDG